MGEQATDHNTQFIAGGGEMGILTRAKDWSKTPLGNPYTWPQSLRTTLSILLNSRFPMFLFWGPELICFYNDAYRPSLGQDGKHPAILGGRGKDHWGEIWPVIKPLIDQVLAGGEATWSEDQLIPIYRNGKLEDVYWTFSYSAVNDESGKPAGVFVTCSETTGKVIMLKKLEENKNQLQFAIEAAELASWDLDPAKNRFSCNNRLKEWHGLPPDEEFDLETGFSRVAEKDRSPLKNAIEEALEFSSGGLLDHQYTIIHPLTKQERIVRVKGKATFKADKTAYRLNGVLQDVTGQVLSWKRIEQNEERFQAAVAAVEGILWTNNAKGEMQGDQPGWESLTGQTYEQYQGYGWSSVIHPEDAQPTVDAWNKAVSERATFLFEHRLKMQNGKWGIFSVRAIPLLNMDGSIREWVGVHTDITAQRLSEAAVRESEQRFRTMAEATSILIALTNESGNPSYFNNAWVVLTGRPMHELVQSGWTDLIHPSDLDQFTTTYQHAFRQKIPFEGEFRILDKDGKYRWLLATGPARFLTEGAFAGYILSGIDITERKQAEEDIKQFKFMADNAGDPFILMREDGSFEYLNKLTLEMWGYTEEETKLLLVPDVDLILDLASFKVIFDKAQKENIPLFETLHKKKNGICYPVEVNICGLMLGGKPYLFAVARDITERKKTEEILMESEQRFRNVANSAPALIWMSGIDQRYNFFNKEWLTFTGRNLEEEYGNGWTAGVHREDIDRCLDIYTTAFERREEFYMEYRLKRKDGEYRWLSHKGVPKFTPDGIFEGYIGACMDIHERFIYQEKLKEDEERLNIIIDASELGTWDLNLITKEINYSDRFLKIIGYHKNIRLTHLAILKHLHPDDLVIRQRAFKQAFINGLLQYESRIIWNDGSIHWMEARGKVFYNADRTPAKMIGTLRDITDEKNYRQKLLEREQKFRLLADSMPQHIWTADPQGNLNYYNQSVFSYSGLTNEQIRKDSWLQIVHPDDREENIRTWMHAVMTGNDFLFEHRFRRHDGEYRWQLSRAKPQKDAAGVIQMWVGTSTDIEDQKSFANELEKKVVDRTRQLEQKNKELEIMNAELKSFAYVSSHDLQEPLRKIQTFATRIVEKEQQHLTITGKDYFRRMQDAARRMQILIEDLLAYSRTNTSDRKFETTDLQLIVNQVKRELQEDIQQKEANIESQVCCKIMAIPFQIKQLVHNIMSNSLKFSIPGKPPHIIITCELVDGNQLKLTSGAQQKEYCHLVIQDNGIGFDAQYSERIFEVFQRLNGKDEFEGTGIGLAIVKKIVENHHGLITTKSEPGNGATFDIYIPVDYQEG